MIREIDINDISDGKKYSANDMAKLGCEDCKGCSDCCQNMEETIVLDPYDIYMLTNGLNKKFEQFLNNEIMLKVIDGIVLPVLAMNNENSKCFFLDESGRCSVHKIRPGICRLFPLGRIYENNGFSYIMQADECSKKNRSKVKISKWLGIEHIAKYEKFVIDWHEFLGSVREDVSSMEQEKANQVGMVLLKMFYMDGYDTEDFYSQFYARIEKLQ